MDPTGREHLSALMDGELGTEPTRFLLRRLDHDPELAAAWSRWHLIRACLAADPTRASTAQRGDEFAARVARALEDEVKPRVPRRRWARYVGGGALAAGVAVVALMLNTPGPGVDPAATVAQQSVQPPGAVATMAVVDPFVAAEERNGVALPWLLSGEPPMVATARPASATVVYGTGLMQPGYLRRAAYAHGTGLPDARAAGSGPAALPFAIVRMPEPMPTSGAADSWR